MDRRGFTLIELMIVVAVIAVVAAIAIPGLLRSKIGSNETSALGSLKAIATGQACFRIGNYVDLNRDGAGEYGFLPEIGGAVRCRSDNAGAANGELLGSTPCVPRLLGAMNPNAEASKTGYLFVVYLPNQATDGTRAYPAPVDVPLATTFFTAYAFPEATGKTGTTVFGMTENPTLFRWPNLSGKYGGTGNGPEWKAILGDNDGKSGVSWGDSADRNGPGQTGVAGMYWTGVGG